jgi:hypothetical protein
MKGFVLTFSLILFLLVLIFPMIEILGAFMDMIKINTALLVSARSAMASSVEESLVREVEIGIHPEKFTKNFKSNFATMLGLTEDLSPKDGGKSMFNGFDVHVIPRRMEEIRSHVWNDVNMTDAYDCFEIEVSTRYQYKTALMKKFSQSIKKPVQLRVNRLQNIKITN